MKRSRHIAVTTVAAMVTATALAACSQRDKDAYDEVCVDRATMVRVEDDDCDRDASGRLGWFYIPYPHAGSLAPTPVGSRVSSSGSFVKPSNATFHRGGFGGTRGTAS